MERKLHSFFQIWPCFNTLPVSKKKEPTVRSVFLFTSTPGAEKNSCMRGFPCVTPSCQRHWRLYSQRCSGPGGNSFSLNYAFFGTSVSRANVYLSRVWQSHLIPGNRGLLLFCFLVYRLASWQVGQTLWYHTKFNQNKTLIIAFMMTMWNVNKAWPVFQLASKVILANFIL